MLKFYNCSLSNPPEEADIHIVVNEDHGTGEACDNEKRNNTNTQGFRKTISLRQALRAVRKVQSKGKRPSFVVVVSSTLDNAQGSVVVYKLSSDRLLFRKPYLQNNLVVD